MKKILSWILVLTLTLGIASFAGAEQYTESKDVTANFYYTADVEDGYTVTVPPTATLEENTKYEGISLVAWITVSIKLNDGYSSSKEVVLNKIGSSNGFGSSGKGLIAASDVPEGKSYNVVYFLYDGMGSSPEEIGCFKEARYMVANKDTQGEIGKSFVATVKTKDAEGFASGIEYKDTIQFFFVQQEPAAPSQE